MAWWWCMCVLSKYRSHVCTVYSFLLIKANLKHLRKKIIPCLVWFLEIVLSPLQITNRRSNRSQFNLLIHIYYFINGTCSFMWTWDKRAAAARGLSLHFMHIVQQQRRKNYIYRQSPTMKLDSCRRFYRQSRQAEPLWAETHTVRFEDIRAYCRNTWPHLEL